MPLRAVFNYTPSLLTRNSTFMPEEILTSENKQGILEILDALREQAANDELLQMFVVTEEASGFQSRWTGTDDRFSIAGFALGAILTRMGFAKVPDDSD